MNPLHKAIEKFNIEKKQAIANGIKYSVSYGKWNDRWNINSVLLDSLKCHLIDKICYKK